MCNITLWGRDAAVRVDSACATVTHSAEEAGGGRSAGRARRGGHQRGLGLLPLRLLLRLPLRLLLRLPLRLLLRLPMRLLLRLPLLLWLRLRLCWGCHCCFCCWCCHCGCGSCCHMGLAGRLAPANGRVMLAKRSGRQRWRSLDVPPWRRQTTSWAI